MLILQGICILVIGIVFSIIGGSIFGYDPDKSYIVGIIFSINYLVGIIWIGITKIISEIKKK